MGNSTSVDELISLSEKTSSDTLKTMILGLTNKAEELEKNTSSVKDYRKKIEYIKDMLPHLEEVKISNTLIIFKGDQQQTLDFLLSNNNGQNDYIVSQTRNNLEIEEVEYLKQEKLRLQLLKECGLDDIASPSKSLEDSEIQQFDSLELEKYYIDKKRNEAKASANVRFYMNGEKEALNGNLRNIRIWKIGPRNIFDLDAADIHYRICESQFRRWSQYEIEEVQYLVNPTHVKTFQKAKEKLAKRHGFLLESMKPLLLFHGTSPQNMDNIMKTNFLISKVGSSTDMGFYGKGVYFGESPIISISYARGNQYLFICLVFVGKAYKMPNVQTGCALVEGYDSHISTTGQEVVIFDPDCILPCYKVRWKYPQNQQQYGNNQKVYQPPTTYGEVYTDSSF
eukprot:gene11765-5103_t